jgi:hypothetical protein
MFTRRPGMISKARGSESDPKMPWHQTHEEFSSPYPKPKSGHTSLYHYTKAEHVPSIKKDGLNPEKGTLFSHADPKHTYENKRPLVHFQVPDEEAKRATSGGTVAPLYGRHVEPKDILSTHHHIPRPSEVASGMWKPGDKPSGRMRSDAGYHSEDSKDLHRGFVEAASIRGHHVPKHVLKDHPDFNPKDKVTYKHYGGWGD